MNKEKNKGKLKLALSACVLSLAAAALVTSICAFSSAYPTRAEAQNNSYESSALQR